ncbi:glycosyltransferase [Acidithiobacillus ferriphilus]|uniref:glycosyltransferase n=1 Tax=Acidithiobacillus ferriphilus TaxID=1689834 RepID=UPI001C0643AA|nr:glycosyltransferase [Acidithiobacillus ferriphilus]MBU2785106.1 glycosyltransferase [Acidithiobacillus ferriphilus]
MSTGKEAQQHLYSRLPLNLSAEDSLAKIARRIPHGSTVLDVGCAVGVLGQYLTEQQGCSVDGIEGNAEAAKIAQPFYRRIMVTDLESADLRYLLEGVRYDRIVCADVLEHLRDPGQVLQRLKDHLTPDGKILISIPNIGHIGVFLELLSGDFRYREEGLLDKTHLRFFTRKSFLRLLADHGFTGQIVDRTVLDLQHTEFSSRQAQGIGGALLREIQGITDNLTYQFIVEAIPTGAQAPLILADDAIAETASPIGPRFYVSAYWRTEDEDFDVSRSLSFPRPFGVERSLVRFDLPTLSDKHILRLDPSDQPGFLRLYSLSLFQGDERLWHWDGGIDSFISGAHHDLLASPVQLGDLGISLLATTEDPWVVLPIPSTSISGADRLEVELSWPMSPDYVFALERVARSFKDEQLLQQYHQRAKALEDANLKSQMTLAKTESQLKQVTDLADSTQIQARKLQAQSHALQQENTALTNELAMITRSRSWRITKPLRAIKKPFLMVRYLFTSGAHGKERRYALARSLYHKLSIPAGSKRRLRVIGKRLLSPHAEQDYQTWIRRYDTLSDTDRKAIHLQITTWENPPKISVILPVYNAPEKFLRLAIESVREQIYPHWELCIADDASSQPDVRRVLEAYAEEDERIKVTYRSENGHISATSNDALALATGDYIALLDHDDALAEHALYWVAAEIIRHPDAKLIYSDEDKIDEKGRRCDPYFKPDWNPELLLGQNYISHLGVYKREQVLNIGGFRPGFEGSQDWDLVLRFTDDLAPAQIRHIPAILYHWRILSGSTASDLGAKPYVVDAAKKAITETLERRDEDAILDSACNGAFHLPRFTVNENPLVSIIIPTRNGLSDLRQCLDSLNRTDYPNTEILVIDNQSDDPGTLAYLTELQRRTNLRVLSYPHPFDYAAMHNWAVPQARGEYVCLLNNDTEVIADRWLTEMLGQGQRRNIGVVGAKLLYPDGTIQHGGVLLGIGGIAGHAHKSQHSESRGHFSRTALVQNFSAVTAACLLMKKDHWNRVGGMAQELTVAFNDVDLCLRLREAGLRNVWLPQALLYHHESKSRGTDIHPDKLRRFALEHAYMQWRWGFVLRNDPAYNPNLTLGREDFSLAWPPRVRHPWRSECISVEIPYGLPQANSEPLTLPPGGEISGSFAVPVGTRGALKGISLLIGNYSGSSNGTLILRLQDADHQTAHAHSTLSSSLDNAMLPLTFSHGEILLHGQERLFFRLRLEGATHPVAIWSYLLDERWGHQILGHEDQALRIVLQVMEDGMEAHER